MEHSSSKVRCSAAAFLLAAGITVSACGDDSGGTTPTPPAGDGGGGFDAGGSTAHDGGGGSNEGGSIDGGVISDAAIPADASAAELAAALSPTGVVVNLRRAELVYTAACARGKECGSPDGLDPTCASGSIETFQRGVAAHYSDACLDSSLDLFGCLVTLPCDDFQQATGCSTLNQAFSDNCAPYQNDDGGVSTVAGP